MPSPKQPPVLPPATNIANSNSSSINNAGNNTNNVHLNVNIDPSQHEANRKSPQGLKLLFISILILMILFVAGYFLKNAFSKSFRKSDTAYDQTINFLYKPKTKIP